MNAPELPEDSSTWPTDPFELLGVTADLEAHEIKRVYARLIRRFKPEHHPEQFRRIRDAYEQVLARVEFWSRLAADQQGGGIDPAGLVTNPKPAFPQPPEIETFADSGSSAHGAEEPPNFRPKIPRVDEIAAAWKLAIEGREEDSYWKLERLFADSNRSDRIAVRLFWMLDLRPDLDRKRVACDWLYEGLKANGLRGRLTAVLHTALRLRPFETLRAAFVDLLETESSGTDLAPLIRLRWEAACRAKRWPMVLEEMAKYGSRIVVDSEDEWARTMFALIDFAAWEGYMEESNHRTKRKNLSFDYVRETLGEQTNVRELHMRAVDELRKIDHVAARLGYWFDRWDHLKALVREYHEARNSGVRVELAELVRLSWSEQYFRCRTPLQKMLATIADMPLYWLDHFDRAAHAGVALLVEFANILDRAEQERPIAERPSDAQLVLLFQEFIAQSIHATYEPFRRYFVERCTRELVEVTWLCEAVLRAELENDIVLKQLAESFAGDGAAILICRAVRIYWI